MKLIIDECVPRALKRLLPERSIVSVQDCGWSGIKNGELLGRLSGNFDVFVTSDKNFRHQQNLSQHSLALLVLPTNRVKVIRELLPEIDAALDRIQPGDLIEFELPKP